MSHASLNTTDLASEEVQVLLRAAMQGDESTLPNLERVLKDNPALWKEAGDLGLQAERSWAATIGGKNLLIRESIHLQLRELKEKLAHASDSALERLLITQVGLAWLEAHWASTRDAQSIEQSLSKGQGDFLQKRVDRGHRRLQTAVKMLATIRKLVKPMSPLEMALKSTAETDGAAKKKQSFDHPRMTGVPVMS